MSTQTCSVRLYVPWIFRRVIRISLLCVCFLSLLTSDLHVALADGFAPEPGAIWHDSFCIGNEVCVVGDVNGDGKADILTFVRDTQGGAYARKVWVALSNGSSFGAASIWHDSFCIGNEVCAVGDVNGDGKADILAFVRDTQGGEYARNVWVALSNGSSFGAASIWHDSFCIGNEVCAVGDVNGDGKADILAFVRDTRLGKERGNVYTALTDYPSSPRPTMLEAFGWNSMRVDGVPAVGKRPLLVILVEFSNYKFRSPHTRDFYDQFFFGPNQPNISDYFRENSHGIFRWEKAAIVGPVLAPDDPATAADESRSECAFGNVELCPGTSSTENKIRARAIELAASRGFDYAKYDDNRDGRLTFAELGIVIIRSAEVGDTWGGTRKTDPSCVRPPNSSVEVCSRIPDATEGASFATVAHELSHPLGTEDLYGSNCLNQNATLLGCTVGGPEDQRESYHLDPWHKFRLGWNLPQIYKLTETANCTALDPVQSKNAYDIAQPNSYSPVILYDPYRGTHEYFILEVRDPGQGGYDVNVPDQGVAIWYVMTDGNHVPPSIPGFYIGPGDDKHLQTSPLPGSDDELLPDQFIGAGNDGVLQTQPAPGSDDKYITDRTVFLVGADKGTRGASSFWKASHGSFSLQLQLNQWVKTSGEGLRVRVGPTQVGGSLEVEWSYHGGPLRPYIDAAPSEMAPASLQTVYGMFGVSQDNRIISLRSHGITYDIPVERWSCDKLEIRVPATIPDGQYELLIYDDSARRTASNRTIVTITTRSQVFLPFIRR